MNKKIVIAVAMLVATVSALAMPCHGPGVRHFYGAPRHMTYHYHGARYHGVHWGHAGRYGWPAVAGGLVGGIVGGAIYNAVATPTTVVATPAPVVAAPAPVIAYPHSTIVSTPAPVVTYPQATVAQQMMVVTPQHAWVPGTYVDSLAPNGAVIRVWQPGHWEYR